jgi:hypothetical protein
VTELEDVRHGLHIGVSVEVVADFIQRDSDEVRQQAAELARISHTTLA